MPPAFVQSKGGTSNTLSSLPVSFTSNNAAGNLLVCSGVVNASGIAGLTITDTQGNTWTIALVDNWKPLSTFFMAYTPNCKAGANTVTIAQLGSLISGAVSEYSGVSPAASLDISGFSDSGSGTWIAATSGNVITRENGELIVAAQANSTGPASVTLGSGFSNLQNDSGNFVSIESQVQATAGAIAGTFTISASSGACGVLTFVPPTDALPFNVWTPKGSVIPNQGGQAPSNPNVIFEGNPKILTGPNVFKMWYEIQGGVSPGLYYAESADGLTDWTQYPSNPVFAGSDLLPKIYKFASTYYLYYGFSGIGVATSPDGITWTIINGTAIAPGSAGQWDSHQLYQLGIAGQLAGTYYGYYGATSTVGGAATNNFVGVATSTDLINWVKGGSNPVIQFSSGNWNFMQVGNTYYGWSQALYAGGQLSAFADIFRISAASPAGPWTQLQFDGKPVATYYKTTLADWAEGATTQTLAMQVGDPNIVYVPSLGNTYLYFTVTTSGGAEGINAAIATGQTPTQIVTTYEGVVGAPISGAPQLNLVTLASDPGTGANSNPLGGNWTPISTTTPYNVAQRANNLIEGTTLANNADSYWNALTWGANQWAQITAAATATAGDIGPELRMNTSGTVTCYRMQWGNVALGSSGSALIKKGIAGTFTTFTTTTGLTVSLGDTLLGVANGDVLLLYYNGILIGAAVGGDAVSSGAAGFELFSDAVATNAQISAFSGGSFQDAPALLASISGNAGVGGATVAYSGTSSGSVTADSFGNYLLSNLPDGSYTITPSLASYTFSPTSSNQILSGTNITGVNFVATQQSSTTAGPSSGLQSVQLYGRLANGSIIAVSIDINGNLAVSGGTGGAINSVDVLKNGVATPAMVYGVTSAGKLVAVAVDANGNLCCANVGAGGGNSSTTVDIAKYATPTPVQAVGREPISGKLYAVPLNASNSLYDSAHPGATPTSSLTVPGVAPRPVQLCGRAPNGKIIAVALDTSGRLCISGSGQSGSANAVDAFKNGVPLAIQLFGINSAGKLQPVPLDANGNLELS